MSHGGPPWRRLGSRDEGNLGRGHELAVVVAALRVWYGAIPWAAKIRSFMQASSGVCSKGKDARTGRHGSRRFIVRMRAQCIGLRGANSWWRVMVLRQM